MVKQLDY